MSDRSPTVLSNVVADVAVPNLHRNVGMSALTGSYLVMTGSFLCHPLNIWESRERVCWNP